MSPSMTGLILARAAALTLTLSLQVGLSAAGEGPREGGKASDEQRVDNCKVPLDRRGATPRPDTCRHDVSTGSTR